MSRICTLASVVASVLVLSVFTPSLATAQTAAAAVQDPSGPRVTSAIGTNVRLTTADGQKQSGKLVSLTATGVVLRRNGQEASVPLATVRKVERTRNGVVYGPVAGFTAGFIYGYGVAEEDAGEAKWAVIIGGLGAAGGAGLGALIDRSRRAGNLIYENPRPSKTVALVPIVSRRGLAGGALLINW